jgi:hypothetical protein
MVWFSVYGLCLVSGKNSRFAVVDFSQGFGFVVWVAFPRVWIYTKHESMGCSKINKINKEKNTANISQDMPL